MCTSAGWTKGWVGWMSKFLNNFAFPFTLPHQPGVSPDIFRGIPHHDGVTFIVLVGQLFLLGKTPSISRCAFAGDNQAPFIFVGGGWGAQPCNLAALLAVGGVHQLLAIHEDLDQAFLWATSDFESTSVILNSCHLPVLGGGAYVCKAV